MGGSQRPFPGVLSQAMENPSREGQTAVLGVTALGDRV